MSPTTDRKRHPSRRLLIWIGCGAAVVVLVPVLAMGILALTIDPNNYKQHVEVAVQQATGRELHIRGPVSVAASWMPTVTAKDVTFANMAGGSRPEMARVDEMQITLSPWALLSGHIGLTRLTLLHPDILLETDAAGRGNWQFVRPARDASAPAAPAGSAAPSPPDSAPTSSAAQLNLQAVNIRDGRLTLRDGVTGATTVFDVHSLAASAATADSPVTVDADLAVKQQDVVIAAQAGPVSALQGAGTAAWPLSVTIDTAGAKLTAAGTVTQPQQLRGYSLRLDGAIPDLQALSWLSQVQLPPLHNVSFSAKLLDQGGKLPDISAVTMQVGRSTLDAVAPGFTLDAARLDMPRLTEPATVKADGQFAGKPLHLNATIGAPALLLPPADLPASAKPSGAFTIDASAELAGGSYTARGAIASPAAKSGMDIVLGAQVPDLAALSPLAGRVLPPLKTLALSGHLVDGPGGYDKSIGLRSAALTLPQADVSGDITLTRGTRPGVQAAITSNRIDADALLASFRTVAAANASPAAPQPAGAPAPPPPPSGNTLIPDTPLPFAMLNSADIDVTAKIGALKLANISASDVSGHVVTKDGRLAAGPIVATLPGGRATVTLGADSNQPAPPVSVAVVAPGLDLKALSSAFGVGDPPTGTLEVKADLRAAGRTPHALARTLEGKAALGLVDASVNNAVLQAALSDVLRAGQMPEVGNTGRTTLRCVAVQLTAAGGVATLHTATLDSTRLLITGTGQVDLGAETLALRLRPMLRTGPGIVVPVRVDGGFKQAKVALDPNGVASANANTALGFAAGLLGGKTVPQALTAERSGDACGPALAAIRAAP
jgi:AsmA protein